ncbi:acyltransferase [Dactylosporangium roseum]|uniref:Acyltransferase n=1 Tax=Dactylosporangium roseum TaxID=47989 RepID=A0ABY5ZC59_9ACTN|nr:acyltransferase [Dactylosporangium roseum]UWZ39452.1 acyltransferase [Dactylosporangium roseum]
MTPVLTQRTPMPTHNLPTHRNRVVDGLRALAMIGVVSGHWLVTGLATDADGALHQQSPLRQLPMLVPLTWILQTLGLFFFVSGYTAVTGSIRAPTRNRAQARWLATRARRLLPPITVFAVLWLLTCAALHATHVAAPTQHVVSRLMISPLWFVLVVLLLSAMTPSLSAAERRLGPGLALAPLAAVAVVDLARFAVWPAMPQWLTYLNGVTGWLVPYVLGVSMARGHLHGRRVGTALVLAGIVAGALLIVVAGYPASAVGVPGEGRSNLAPPSLLTVALSLVQIGLALMAWKRLERLLERSAWWATVTALSLSAMTVFLWHQTALLIVAGTGHAFLRDPAGLIGAPDETSWLVHRLAWLPVFAGVLALLRLLFRSAERFSYSTRTANSERKTP